MLFAVDGCFWIIFVCVCVRMFVCVCVCMHGCVHACVYVCTTEFSDICGCVHACVYVCTIEFSDICCMYWSLFVLGDKIAYQS